MRDESETTRGEAGFTLVELMVASLLTVIVVGVIGGILISSQNTQGVVSTVGTATTSGQLVTNSIESGIRNSENWSTRLRPLHAHGARRGDQLLTALVVGGGATAVAKCTAWYYSASTGSIRYRSSATAIPTPTSATLSSWSLLSSGVMPISGTSVFSLTGTNGVSIAFKENAGRDPAVPFQSTVYSLTTLTGSISC
ncbi:MAG: hypothetical protein WDM88_11105 [Galbitalea sp.]